MVILHGVDGNTPWCRFEATDADITMHVAQIELQYGPVVMTHCVHFFGS